MSRSARDRLDSRPSFLLLIVMLVSETVLATKNTAGGDAGE